MESQSLLRALSPSLCSTVVSYNCLFSSMWAPSFCLWRSPDLGMVSVVVVVVVLLLLLLVGATFVLSDLYTIQENL